MIKPDVIITWAKHMDYPYARYALQRYRKYFNRVLIALTDHGKLEDYTTFLTNNIDASFKSVPMGQGDWRNNAVKTMLEKSDASDVMFLEQDLLIKDERFFEVLLNPIEYTFRYYEEQGRFHPACALVPRAIIEKTSKDFSARPPAFDHFGLFFREVTELANPVDLEALLLHSGEDYYHLAGLTQNYHALPYFKPDEFLTYNHYAKDLPIPHCEFRTIMAKVDVGFDKDKENKTVKGFFPEKEGE